MILFLMNTDICMHQCQYILFYLSKLALHGSWATVIKDAFLYLFVCSSVLMYYTLITHLSRKKREETPKTCLFPISLVYSKMHSMLSHIKLFSISFHAPGRKLSFRRGDFTVKGNDENFEINSMWKK